MMMKYLYLSFCLLASCVSLLAGNVESYPFKRLTKQQNLSHYSVMALYQDERGLIWMGTRNGVNVYDGSEMHIYKHNPDDAHSLLNNSVRNIIGDRNGHIFLLTLRGVCCYEVEKESFSTLTQHPAAAICFDRQLYMASANKVYAYNGRQFELYCELPDANARIFSLASSNDSLMIGTEGHGLYVFGRGTRSWGHPLQEGKIGDIFKDSKGRCWLSTWEDGLYCLEGDRLRHYTHRSTDPSTLNADFVRLCREDQQGNLWVGTFKGLCRYLPQSDTFASVSSLSINDELPTHSVWSLLADSQGSLWVGTYFGGVSYFNPRLEMYKHYRMRENEELGGLSFPVIGQMTEDDRHNLWICTEGGGLNQLDRTTGKFTWYRHSSDPHSISHDNVKSLYYDREREVLWVGTHLGGLNKLDLRTRRFTRYSYKKEGRAVDKANIICAIQPYRNTLLLATHDGVLQFDIDSGTFTPLFKSGQEGAIISLALDLKIDRNGLLWISGVEKGAYSYDFATRRLRLYTHHPSKPSSLSSNGVNCMYLDGQQHLWLCMSESGLDRYHDESDDFSNYNERRNDLQSDCVYGACSLSPDHLLLITESGVSNLDLRTGMARNYDVQSGMPLSGINQNAIYRTADGEVFIGGTDGLVSFRPDDLALRPASYTIFPYRLFIQDRPVEVGDETGILQKALSKTPAIRLKASQNMFSIQYAMTDYVPMSRNNLQYKLEPFSDSWTTLAGGRRITYTNLNPGRYTLLVRAVAPVGRQPVVSRLSIEILPPLYATWWAWLLYVVAAGIIGYSLVRVYKHRIRLQTELKYERKHIEDVEALNQNKLRFFTNISHEFRLPLTLIIGQMEMLLQMRNIPSAVYNRIHSVYRNGVQLQELITELLDFRKQEQGHMRIRVAEQNIVGFLYDNYLLFHSYALHRKINFKFNKSNDVIQVWYDTKQLQKVLNNLLSNAFKYTPDGGEIALSVRKGSNQMVVIEVSDSGCGIEGKDLDKIFDRFYQTDHSMVSPMEGVGVGLALTKGIVELHHGTIEVYSEPGEGSTFTIRLPLGKEAFAAEELVGEEVRHPSVEQQVLFEQMEEEARSDQEMESARKILVVEDEAELLQMLVGIFAPYYQVLTAVNGEQAWETVVNDLPDIVLADVVIPGISGMELCKRIKENSNTCHIPIMLLTGRTATEHKLEGLKVGADDYVTKPFEVNVLLSRCRNLVNNRILLQEKYSKQPQKSNPMFAITPADKEFMDRAMQLIEDNLDKAEFSVDQFAREMSVSRTKLYAKVKAITNQTPNELILSMRMKKAAVMLKEHPELSIAEISDKLGFCSPRYFSRCFKDKFNVSPQVYRRGE